MEGMLHLYRRRQFPLNTSQVPVDPPSNTHHPSAALGIAHVRVLAEPETFTALSKQLTSVIGTQPDVTSESESIWLLHTVGVPSAQASRNATPKLVLSTPRDSEERASVESRGAGIYEVAFFVDKGGEAGTVDTPYGKIVWTPQS